jgi:hypothetical protein
LYNGILELQRRADKADAEDWPTINRAAEIRAQRKLGREQAELSVSQPRKMKLIS